MTIGYGLRSNPLYASKAPYEERKDAGHNALETPNDSWKSQSQGFDSTKESPATRLIFSASSRQLRNRWVRTVAKLIGKPIDTLDLNASEPKDAIKAPS